MDGSCRLAGPALFVGEDDEMRLAHCPPLGLDLLPNGIETPPRRKD
jgi:hypothetical protein